MYIGDGVLKIMNHAKKRKLYIFFLCCSLLIAGCGRLESDTSSENTVSSFREEYYMTEQTLPNPDEALQTEGEMKELLYCMQEETIYRVTLFPKDDSIGRDRPAWGIQLLKAPYKEWDSYLIYNDEWIDGKKYYAYNFCVAPGGSIWVILWDNEDYFLAEWKEGQLESPKKITEEFVKFDIRNNCIWNMDGSGNHYFYYENDYIVYDKDFVEKTDVSIKGSIEKIIPAPGGKVFWFGKQSNSAYLGLYGLDENESSKGSDIQLDSNKEGHIKMDEQNNIIMADRQGVWKQGQKAELLCSYVNNSILCEQVRDISILNSEKMLLLARDGKDEKILTVIKGENTERAGKTEITIATEAGTFLERYIVMFNRQSEEFYLTLWPWISSEESYLEYSDRMQLEISTGKGPDLVDDTIIDLEVYAKQGLLYPLDKELDLSKGQFVEAALETGKIDGTTYGIPISFNIRAMQVGKTVAGVRDKWTRNEFMQRADELAPDSLIGRARAWDIVYYLACWDEQDDTFVDWENGTCHFETSEFIELLEFAKRFEETRYISADLYSKNLKKGEMFADCSIFGDLQYYLYLCRLCDGEGVFIGYPSVKGNGIYVEGDNFAINNHSKNKEGAIAFLQFLLSEEVQKNGVEYGIGFPVRTDAMQYAVELAKNQKEDLNTYRMSEEQEEAFWDMIQRAKPKGRKYTRILDILYEETEAYFTGNKSIEEVVSLIQNRVQLYLDEQQ